MPKRLRQRRRGKAKPVFLSPTHRWGGRMRYPMGSGDARVTMISHQAGRNCPVMMIRIGKERTMLPAPIGVAEGDMIHIGESAAVVTGNVLPLAKIPEGTRIFNVELSPGDGGKLVRGSGCSARVVAKDQRGVIVQLPSKATRAIDPKCRAMVGVIGGGGKTEKPIVKAGKMFHMLNSKSRVWPVVSGVAMNPVDHPFGGGGTRSHKPKTTSRRGPPGTKVGSIAARRTGGKKTGGNKVNV